jgi:glycosyltransferase involved in cell wall biosynthesis
MPAISVILPVFNAEKYLKDSIESLFAQSFSDFELIIIDDCSTDNSFEILEGFSDPRIRLYRNDKNLRVVKTLNKGLELAQGKYIARMDADDIAHPERFQQQINYFDKNPDIDIVGTWVQTFGTENDIMRAAVEHEHIKVRLFFLNPMFHPAVMFKRESFLENDLWYEDYYNNAEDYGLWVKAIDKVKFANIPQILLKYRIHATNVSVLKASNKQVLNDIHFHIYQTFLRKLNVDATSQELDMHRKLGSVQVEFLTSPELTEYVQWLKKLTMANIEVKYFNQFYFSNVILSYLLYLSGKTDSRITAIKLIKEMMGDLFNIGDFTRFFISRTRNKLKPVNKF